MKVLIKIGYHSFLLPDDKGLPTLLKTLGGSIEVEDERYVEQGFRFLKPAEIKCEMLPGRVVVNGLKPERPEKAAKRLALPEPESILL